MFESLIGNVVSSVFGGSKYTEDLITLYRNADTESTRQALIKQLRNNGNHRIALNLESSLPEEKEA